MGGVGDSISIVYVRAFCKKVSIYRSIRILFQIVAERSIGPKSSDLFLSQPLCLKCLQNRGLGTHIWFCTGRAPEQGIILRIPSRGQGITFVKIQLQDRVHIGSIWSFLTPKRRSRPFFALREYDLNRLDGNISTFSDRFLIHFQGRAQFCLNKLKDMVLFKNLSLRDRDHFQESDSGTG